MNIEGLEKHHLRLIEELVSAYQKGQSLPFEKKVCKEILEALELAQA